MSLLRPWNFPGKITGVEWVAISFSIFPTQGLNPGLPHCRLILYLQCKRPGFNLWLGKISWRRERLLTPVFWTGEFHGLYSPWGRKESDTTERLSLTDSAGTAFDLKWLSGCVGVSSPTTGETPSRLPRSHSTLGPSSHFPDKSAGRTRTCSQPYSTCSEPAVWDKGIPGEAISVLPVKISPKPGVAYPNKRQDCIKLEAK